MSTSYIPQGKSNHSVRAQKHDPDIAKGKLRESSEGRGCIVASKTDWGGECPQAMKKPC